MFIIELTYLAPLNIIEAHLTDHRNFLEKEYQKNSFIASGPQNPRVGGILLSQLKDRQTLLNILHQDPFYIHQLVEYKIIEFHPVKYHRDFSPFIESAT